MKKILFKMDCHLDAKNDLNPAYRLVKKFAKDWKPDIVVDGGDLFEFEYLGSFAKDKLKSIEGKTFRADYDLGLKELDFWQGVSKKYIQVEGNHDQRLVRLVEADPRFEGLVELSRNLDFASRKIDFYSMLQKPLTLGKLIVIHGYWSGKYPARRHLDRYKQNIVFGHGHKFDTASDSMPILETEIQAWEIGCLCSKSPDWRKGCPTSWMNGFAVMYLDDKTGRFNLYPIYISKYYEFFFENRRWSL